MNFSWAARCPDLQSICEKYNLRELSNPHQVCYSTYKGITQEGPQCGLVALAICMKSPTRDTVNKLLKEAQDLGYTYNGEMFSVRDMVELAKRNLTKKVTLYEGLLNTSEIKDLLLNGVVMLVPYDCDRNHHPCRSKGHKAHWAFVTGIIDVGYESYVTARQGKSKHIGIWRLTDLSESNAQLEEFSPDRKLHDTCYKLPDNGIGGDDGLKCKSICIWPMCS